MVKVGCNLWHNFGRILPKVGGKGRRQFSEDVPYFTVITKTQRQRQNVVLFLVHLPAERCIYVVKLAEFLVIMYHTSGSNFRTCQHCPVYVIKFVSFERSTRVYLHGSQQKSLVALPYHEIIGIYFFPTCQ